MQARRRNPTEGGPITFTLSPTLFESVGCLVDSQTLTMQALSEMFSFRPTTYLTFADWRLCAEKYLHLNEITSRYVFDAFHTLSSKADTRLENTRLLLGKMGGIVDENKYRDASSTRTISLAGMYLFLNVQAFLQGKKKHTNSGDALKYIRDQLPTIVSMIGVTKTGEVSDRDAQELALLFREYTGGVEHPFGSGLASLWRDQERTIPSDTLAKFIATRLSSQEVVGRAGNAVVTARSTSVQVISCPFDEPPSTWTSGYSLKVHQASQTSFYIPAALPNTTIEGLSNCTVQLGPVGGVLYINNCEQCIVSAICGSVVVSNCQRVTLFICTNTPPILDVTTGTDVQLAPYNTHYAQLEEHIAASGLNPKFNLWRVGVSEGKLLPPSKFSSASFPVAPPSNATIVTRTNPCPLPREYQDAITQRLNAFNATSLMLQEAYRELENGGRKDLADDLRNKVQQKFVDWAVDKGQLKSLIDLLHGHSQPHH